MAGRYQLKEGPALYQPQNFGSTSGQFETLARARFLGRNQWFWTPVGLRRLRSWLAGGCKSLKRFGGPSEIRTHDLFHPATAPHVYSATPQIAAATALRRPDQAPFPVPCRRGSCPWHTLSANANRSHARLPETHRSEAGNAEAQPRGCTGQGYRPDRFRPSKESENLRVPRPGA
jgi:hypothetical protein